MPSSSPGRPLFFILLIVITIAVAVILNTNTANPVPSGRTGTLTGNVTIGPLCPVEPCTLSHDQILAVYTARPIIITTK